MFYAVLFCSLVLLVVANLLNYDPKKGIIACIVFGSMLAFSGVGLFFLTTLIAVQAAVLVFIGAACTLSNRRMMYVPMSIAASICNFTFVGLLTLEPPTSFQDHYVVLESDHPRQPAAAAPEFEPLPDYALREFVLANGYSYKNVARWKDARKLEFALPADDANRTAQLELIHQITVEMFVETPGFGGGRMLRPTHLNEGSLADRVREQVFTQLSPGNSPTRSAAREVTDISPENARLYALRRFQPLRVFDHFFSNTTPVGVITQSDMQRGARRSRKRWHLPKIHLIGIMVHEKPVVYLGLQLPRMKSVRYLSTEPLDEFERTALNSIRLGRTLVQRHSPTSIRVVGAIRARTECLVCHKDYKRDDLLGAFSYTLLPSTAADNGQSNRHDGHDQHVRVYLTNSQ